MTETPTIMRYVERPRRPAWRPPPGACDAHCHVFGPAAAFPYAPERTYTPHDAGRDRLYALHRHLGLERGVVVQASCHGRDNSAMADALEQGGGRYRGVAMVGPDMADDELDRLHAAGVRGVRFNFVRHLGGAGRLDAIEATVARVAERGWHVVVHLDADGIDDAAPFLTSLSTTMIVDHMGRPRAADGLGQPGFSALLRLMEDERFWVKVSGAERISSAGPPFYDAVPFARKLVETYPDRVLWGTDWPHPNIKRHMPDDGELVDLIPLMAPTEALQRALLVDNPKRLYWGKV